MRPWLVVTAVLLPLMAGCGVDRGHRHGKMAVREQSMAMEPSSETFALGTAVTPSGAVAKQSAGDNFIRGGEVLLSVDVGGASSDQTVEVQWVDPQGRVLHRDERHATQGMRYLRFSSGRTADWPRGEHHAVIRIDGRTVSQKSFALL